MSPEERYVKKRFNPKNIFHVLGFARFATYKDPLDKPLDYISYDSKQLMSKFLSYRVNREPSENINDFDEKWIHGFYKFLKETGQDIENRKSLNHNPFILDINYKFKADRKGEDYSLNTFGEQIHKQTLAYVKVLHEAKLIPFDFRKKIDASAFVKTEHNKKGHLTDYDDVVNFLEPSEFLTLMYTNLQSKGFKEKVLNEIVSTKEKINKQILANYTKAELAKLQSEETDRIVTAFEKTRDSFVIGLLLGGLRVSDLISSQKKIIILNSLSLVQFNQKKTGGLVKNLILGPAQKLLDKYNGEVPVKNQSMFNRNLKDLFRMLGFNRMVRWTELTMNGAIEYEKPLHEVVTSKFMRCTYYVLCGVMGEPIDSVIKRTGHTDRAVALKHYYGVGSYYKEKDLLKLLEIFDRKTKS